MSFTPFFYLGSLFLILKLGSTIYCVWKKRRGSITDQYYTIGYWTTKTTPVLFVICFLRDAQLRNNVELTRTLWYLLAFVAILVPTVLYLRFARGWHGLVPVTRSIDA